MEILLTADNLVCNLFTEATVAKVLNVTEEQFEQIKSSPEYFAGKYLEETDSFELVELLDENTLRNRRNIECFALLDNKSKLWWDNLSVEDYNAINTGYKAGLNVTLTKQIPELPNIFKESQ